MNRFRLFTVLGVAAIAGDPASTAHAAQGAGKVVAVAPPPTVATIVALADVYLASAEKTLRDEDRELMKAVRAQFRAIELRPQEIPETIDALVSTLTVALASMKSADGLTAASAFLVKVAPRDPRVTNLFGSVLHSTNRLRDAVTVLEFTAALSPDGVLAKLNLANAYFDRGLDAKAKPLIEQALREEPENRQAWLAMATYWFRRKNFGEHQKALLRAASFAGYVQREATKADVLVDANEVKPGDDLATMERKVAALARGVPLSTGDLIEAVDPPLARAIKERAGRLLPGERMRMPNFPQINTSTNRAYAEAMPVVVEFVRAFAEQYGSALQADALGKTGIKLTDDSATMHAKAMTYANAELARQLGSAQDILKFLGGADIPGVPKGQLSQALGQVKGTAASMGAKLPDKPVDPDRPPGFDSGTPFAKANYRNYLITSRSIESYIRAYFTKFEGEEREFLRLYGVKTAQERQFHQQEVEKIARMNSGFEATTKAELQERLRHARAMNRIGEEYYRFWVNLYVPDYTQRMKPMLESYWNTVALYVRNMHDLEVVSREYSRVRNFYLERAMQAVTIAGNGAAFAYVAATDEEIDALEKEIRRMEEDEAPKQRAVFLRDTKVHTLPTYEKAHEKDWVDFIGENLNYELSGQFLGVKLTAQSIEFNAWAFGPAAGIKIDFVDEKVDTYIGLKAKWEVGIKVGDVKLGATADGEFAMRTASWDFVNGTYKEGYPPPQVSANAMASAGNFSLSADAKYDATKGVTAKAGSKGGFGPLTASGEISYSHDAGLAAKSGLSAGAGPVKASAQATLDSQLNSKASASVGVSGQGLSAQKDLSLTPPKP